MDAKESVVSFGVCGFYVWFVYVLLVMATSGCSFKVESEYFGRTGKRDVSYSPTVEDGDEQYVKRVNKRY